MLLWDETEDGLWCPICGYHIATEFQVTDEDFEEPEICKNCGYPDELDPEKI